MKTKVTIIGNGGREDSLRWKLSTEQVKVESEVSEHLTIIGPEAPIAEGLTDELESKLIPVARIQVAGYGDSRPRFNPDTAYKRNLNRRVQILLLPENQTR